MSDPLGLINSNGPVQGPTPGAGGGLNPPQAPGASEGPSFKQTLLENIERVNEMQNDAERAIEDLTAGRRDDLANVLIAKQKADVAFRMLLQVRNQLVDAYDEIKQLRV